MQYSVFTSLTIAGIIVTILFSPCYAQSKKQIKKLEIRTVTELTTIIYNGKKITYKSAFTSYNKKAKPAEQTEYNPDGTIIKKETAKYDSRGNKIEEYIYESTATPGKNIRVISKYDAEGNKIEDMEYDGAGKLMRKQQFSYDRFNNKKQELNFDPSGKLIRKVIYTYDGDELRTLRREYNERNELVSERTYQYTF